MDLNSLSDEELEAIASGNLESLPTSTLEVLASDTSENESYWNFLDSSKQYLSGAVEGIAELPATIADINPLGIFSPYKMYELSKSNPDASFNEQLSTLGPDFNFTTSQKTQEALAPYLSEQDPNYRYARTLGQFTGPGVFGKALQGVKALPKVAKWGSALLAPEKSLIRQGIVDIGAALGSQGSADAWGESPVSRFFGALFGGGSAGLTLDAGKNVRRLFSGATPEEIKGTAAKTIQEMSGMKPEQIDAAIESRPKDALGELMTSAEVTQNPGLAQLQMQMTSSGEGANRLGALTETRSRTRDEILNSMSTAPKQTKEAIGTQLITQAKAVEGKMGQEAEALWDAFGRNEPVNVRPEQLNLAEMLGKKQAGLPVNSKVNYLVNQFLGGEEGGAVLTTGALQDIRSDALELTRDATLTGSDIRILNFLQSAADKAVKRELPAEEYAAWGAARQKTKIKEETFGRGTAGGSLTEKTARPANAPTNAFKGDKQSVQEARAALADDPSAMEAFKRFVLEDIPRDADDKLTPAKMKKYLERNEGGLSDLFEPEHYANMQRVLEDLQSEASVSKRAYASSKGQSVTQQRLTVAGAIEDKIVKGVSGVGGKVGEIIQSIKRTADIKDQEGVRAILTEAVFDPSLVRELAAAPTDTRILKAAERLLELVNNFSRTTSRAGLLSSSQPQQQEGRKEGVQPQTKESLSKSEIQLQQKSSRGFPSKQAPVEESYKLDRVSFPNSPTNLDPTQEAFERLKTFGYGDEMRGEDVDVEALVKAVIGQESGGKADALSPKGAQGLMQIMPETAKEIAAELGYASYDLNDAKTNREFGTYYLRKMLEMFGDPKLALAAYNAGPGKVSSWIKQFGTANWDEIARKLRARKAYAETIAYVPGVLKRLNNVVRV